MRPRVLVIVLGLCGACAAHRQTVGLDVTTTAATVPGPSTSRVFESAAAAYEAESASRPTELPSAAPTDAQMAARVHAAYSAMIDHASLARTRAKDGRVRDFAHLVYDRMHEADLRLALVHVAPAPPASTGWLDRVAAQSQIDFDTAYLEVQLGETQDLLQMADAIIPATRDAALARQLMELRPKLDDLYVRAFDLEQAIQ
jgi:predicted outer membrane protein